MSKFLTKQVEVEAVRFEGGEDAAQAVIAWSKALGAPPVTRFEYEGSWNDQHPDLWLKCDAGYVKPGWWVVFYRNAEGDYVLRDVLDDDEFLEEFDAA